jgi:hypothetical protein
VYQNRRQKLHAYESGYISHQHARCSAAVLLLALVTHQQELESLLLIQATPPVCKALSVLAPSILYVCEQCSYLLHLRITCTATAAAAAAAAAACPLAPWLRSALPHCLPITAHSGQLVLQQQHGGHRSPASTQPRQPSRQIFAQ